MPPKRNFSLPSRTGSSPSDRGSYIAGRRGSRVGPQEPDVEPDFVKVDGAWLPNPKAGEPRVEAGSSHERMPKPPATLRGAALATFATAGWLVGRDFERVEQPKETSSRRSTRPDDDTARFTMSAPADDDDEGTSYDAVAFSQPEGYHTTAMRIVDVYPPTEAAAMTIQAVKRGQSSRRIVEETRERRSWSVGHEVEMMAGRAALLQPREDHSRRSSDPFGDRAAFTMSSAQHDDDDGPSQASLVASQPEGYHVTSMAIIAVYPPTEAAVMRIQAVKRGQSSRRSLTLASAPAAPLHTSPSSLQEQRQPPRQQRQRRCGGGGVAAATSATEVTSVSACAAPHAAPGGCLEATMSALEHEITKMLARPVGTMVGTNTASHAASKDDSRVASDGSDALSPERSAAMSQLIGSLGKLLARDLLYLATTAAPPTTAEASPPPTH